MGRNREYPLAVADFFRVTGSAVTAEQRPPAPRPLFDAASRRGWVTGAIIALALLGWAIGVVPLAMLLK